MMITREVDCQGATDSCRFFLPNGTGPSIPRYLDASRVVEIAHNFAFCSNLQSK